MARDMKFFNKKALLFLFLLYLGIIFRYAFIKNFPQPFVWDQLEYYQYALAMVNDFWVKWSWRTYGYPLLLATLYKIIGPYFLSYLTFVHTLFDIGSAILIYLLSVRVFGKRSPAILGFILYLFNPFTSAYIDVRLTEILSLFLITLIFYLITVSYQNGKGVLQILIGILLGYLVAVKPSYLPWTIFLLLTEAILLLKSKRNLIRKRILHISALFLFYAVPFIYTVMTNYIHFQQFSLVAVDNIFIRDLYLSHTLHKPDPNTGTYPADVITTYYEYSFKPQTPQQRRELTKEYWDRSMRIIKNDPAAFIKRSFINALGIWEKSSVDVYHQNLFRYMDGFIYWLNRAVLGLALIGIVGIYKKFMREHSRRICTFFILISILFFLYHSVLYAFTIGDERYTIPAYSLVFLYAGWGMYYIFHIIRNWFCVRKYKI